MAENPEPESWSADWWHYICPECLALLPANQLMANQHIDRCRRLTVLLDAHEPQPHASGSVPTSPGDRPAIPPIGTDGHYDRSGMCAWAEKCPAHWNRTSTSGHL